MWVIVVSGHWNIPSPHHREAKDSDHVGHQDDAKP